MSADAAPPRTRLGRRLFWSFILLMVVLTGVFAALGNWQVNRLHEKEELAKRIEDRLFLAPQALPPVAEWVGFDAAIFDYRPVTMTGAFDHPETILVFTSLSEPRGQQGGPGYWVMTPFRLTGGGVVWVNRGFIPQNQQAAFGTGASGPQGEMTITGIARSAEAAGGFTPGPNARKRIEWVRDPERLAAMADPMLTPFAPVYVDMPAGEPGALPQGGETRVSFTNNHLGYAITWFGFAILTPILLLVWVIKQRQS